MSIWLIIVIVVVLLAVGNIAWRKKRTDSFSPWWWRVLPVVVAWQGQPGCVRVPGTGKAGGYDSADGPGLRRGCCPGGAPGW